MRRRYSGVMRASIAVAGCVFVHCIRAHFDHRREVLCQAERNVRIEPII